MLPNGWSVIGAARGRIAAIVPAGVVSRPAAQAPEAPLTTDEVQRRILQKLPGPERKMLSALLPYREGLTGEQLAELAGYTVNTGSYNNARGRLRSLGLVEYQGGKIVPKSLLYLEP